MRQVPHYLLIGNGRVASHFQHYFSLLGLSYSVWHRRESLQALKDKLPQASHVLLLINDQAIDACIQQHILPTGAVLIHCSGSLVSQYAYGAHPLMTFSHALYELSDYQAIPFVLEHDAPAMSDLLPGLPNQHARLDKAQKAKYHALCVLSGNFSCMLWQKLFSSLEREFNIPAELAVPYLQQITRNLSAHPMTALTGPLVRNDTAAINSHLTALQSDPFQAVYQSFVACYQQLKEEGLV